MIKFFDISRQNKVLEKELNQAIKDVIDRGIFILGSKVEEFEKAFSQYIGVKYAVGVASGTDAISLALLAAGVERGDEVILPANAYPTAFAITAIGAVPRLVDVDPVTYNIDPIKIPQAITKKTKAIIPVHLYGQPADMGAVLEIGEKYKIQVVEDCAQAHGAEIISSSESAEVGHDFFPHLPNSLHDLCLRHESRGAQSRGRAQKAWSPADSSRLRHSRIFRKVGSIGDVGCFSFYPTKNLGCFGDGGMVVANNEEIYKRVKLLRMYGEERRYQSVLLGRNSRLDELQAAILLVKLKYLDKWNERRREIANLYRRTLSNLQGIALQRQGDALKRHGYHLFVIRSKKRDELRKYLEENGVQTAIHYPIPIHLVPSMKFLGGKIGDFPESEKACKEILSLPMFPELADEEVKQITEIIKNFSTHD